MNGETSPPPSWFEQPEDEHDVLCPLSPDYKAPEPEGGEDEYLEAEPRCICAELQAAARQDAADFARDLRDGR